MATDSYFVTFTAHVDERRRPENFPHKVHVKEVFDDVESIPHLQFLVNDKFLKLIASQGLVVLKNEDEPLEQGRITFDKRIYVPWHMITHMELDVKHIAKVVNPSELIIPPAINSEKKPPELVN